MNRKFLSITSKKQMESTGRARSTCGKGNERAKEERKDARSSSLASRLQPIHARFGIPPIASSSPPKNLFLTKAAVKEGEEVQLNQKKKMRKMNSARGSTQTPGAARRAQHEAEPPASSFARGSVFSRSSMTRPSHATRALLVRAPPGGHGRRFRFHSRGEGKSVRLLSCRSVLKPARLQLRRPCLASSP